jgi:hypothetical protein
VPIDVRLPEEFVQHATSMRFVIPADLKDEDVGSSRVTIFSFLGDVV